jgi:hypothetical protein
MHCAGGGGQRRRGGGGEGHGLKYLHLLLVKLKAAAVFVVLTAIVRERGGYLVKI